MGRSWSVVLDLSIVAGASTATAGAWAKMGAMNRDDKPTSMNALMILQAAADTIQYRFVFSGDFMTGLIEPGTTGVVRGSVPCYRRPVISAAGGSLIC